MHRDFGLTQISLSSSTIGVRNSTSKTALLFNTFLNSSHSKYFVFQPTKNNHRFHNHGFY